MSATLARSVAPFAARMDSNALPNKLSALVRRTGRQAVSTSNASVGPDDEYCEECLSRVRPDWEYCPYCGCDLPSGGDDVATGGRGAADDDGSSELDDDQVEQRG